MASPEYSPDNRPCAFCGFGETPTSPPSTNLCDLCLQLIDRANGITLVAYDPATSPRRVAMFPVPSDNLARAGWRSIGGPGGTGVLVLQFRSSGTMIRYANVSRQWWELFWQAPSKGSFFSQTVRANKDAHPFTKIN